MKTIFYIFDQKSSIFIFFIRVRRICSKFSFKFHKISSKNDIFILFSRNPIRKPTGFTLAGTRISLFRLQNNTFSLFSYVYGVLAPKVHHEVTKWCPTIPFWTPKWSQTSSASSAGRLGGGPWRAWPARQAGPAAWPPPGGPVGCFPGRERGKSSGGGAARRRWWSPPTPITAGGLFSIYSS